MASPLIPPSLIAAAPRRGQPPSHPGEMLRDIVLPALKEAGTPRTRVAELIGMSRPSFYEFLAGKTPVTAELALKLGKLCGNGPALWMNMQQAWDLAQAQAKLGAALDEIPTLTGKAA